ncbi:MAG: BREX system P-loop protein BrxC, partial [Prevotella sp.]|nr:BREX system P-loop protein BrxC [Prevotella sp.]
RILEKNNKAEIELSKMFEQNKSKLDAQFILPSTYYAYRNADEFVNYYPFVPYQFQLIMKVLDSFVKMGYVDTQVKGNERSLLNITFSIAKETADWETGQFIPFDRFYGAMFQGSMKHLGQRAFENARLALELLNNDYEKQAFYRRVVYVLFMICNLSEVDKQTFSATIDNIVTLLMEKVDENKAVMKDKVSNALGFLEDKSVIHKVKKDNGTEIYEFYTQEESQVAQLIINTQVDSNTYSEELYRIISTYFDFSNKKTYATRDFKVGFFVDSRSWSSNNADIIVDFLTNVITDSPDQFAFNNQRNHLVFFLYPKFSENKQLRGKFLHYCQVVIFSKTPAISVERQKITRVFQDEARKVLERDIKPALQGILDTCPIISGQSVLTASEIGSAKGKERYVRSLDCHLGKLYESAQLVANSETPKSANELRDKILRPAENTLMETPLSKAEEKMKDYLDRQMHDVTVYDIVKQFEKPPYGWSEIATIYTLNELVRRNLYAYNYNNNPNVSREEVARNIVRESSRFTVEKAKAIPQSVINSFIDAWKYIFNVMSITNSNDPNELYKNCKDSEKSALNKSKKEYSELSRKLSSCPCVTEINKAVDLLEEWSAIRSQVEFFTTITAAKDTAKTLFDSCKDIASFANDQYDKYSEIIKFIDDNRDNFDFLPDNFKIVADELKAIQTDMLPWDKLPKYFKYMRTLKGLLQERRKELEDQIKKKYEEVFDEVESYARESGVSTDIIPDRNTKIESICATNNLYALKNNLDTSNFRREQYKNINDAINEANKQKHDEQTQDGGDGIGTNPAPSPKPRIRETINITTHTFMPLRTEADVDEYIQKIKAEIMNHLTGNNEIVII